MFKVVWDNGVSACGEFSFIFDTWGDADNHGREWAHESNIRDEIPLDAEDAYSYEVVTVGENDDRR